MTNLATDALVITGIDAFYGDSHVLHGVSLSLQPGRLLGLLGRNGAGKTTCMSTIMGFLKPRARLDQPLWRAGRRACAGHHRAQRHLPRAAGPAHVPHAHRAREPDGRGAAGCERRRRGPGWTIDRVFELFPRLKERHAQVAGSLSGGEQQMLAIGRALMGNPRVLLMDEPSEGLAPQIVAEVGRTIAQLKAEGQSIVLVEQNIKLTLDLADDVVIINTGAVVFKGEAKRIKLDDADRFAASRRLLKFRTRDNYGQWPTSGTSTNRRRRASAASPGSESRPKSITVDMHAHVAVPRAAEFVKPASRPSNVPLDHFSNAETKALMAKQDADIRERIRNTDARFRRHGRHGRRHAARLPGAAAAATTRSRSTSRCRPRSAINDGIAEYVGKHPDRCVALGGVPLSGRQRGRQGARALHETAQVQGRRNPHQCRRQGVVRSGLCAVLEKGRRARRAGA